MQDNKHKLKCVFRVNQMYLFKFGKYLRTVFTI